MRWWIEAQGDVVPQVTGQYSSFPSLVEDPNTGEVILVYRQGIYDETDPRPGMRAHGLDGSLYARRFLPATRSFGDPIRLFSGFDFPPGLIDGILSPVGERLALFFRRYPTLPSLFLSQGESVEDLTSYQVVSTQPELPWEGAQWGKILTVDEGQTWLQVIYGAPPSVVHQYVQKQTDQLTTFPGLFESTDQGYSWHLRSWIAPSQFENGLNANETSVVAHQRKLFALMRVARTYPGPLFLSVSKDDGHTWTMPERSGIFGEAPMWLTLPNGELWAGYRGYQANSPRQGGTFSIARFDPEYLGFTDEQVIETYDGNHYDGGYGDLLWIEAIQCLLVVYYYSSDANRRNPWIRYALLSPL